MHSSILSQTSLPSSRQGTGSILPSVILRIMPTVYSSGRFVRRYPPWGPRILLKYPALVSTETICSRYFPDTSCRLAISFTLTGFPSASFIAISSIKRRAYLPFVEILIMLSFFFFTILSTYQLKYFTLKNEKAVITPTMRSNHAIIVTIPAFRFLFACIIKPMIATTIPSPIHISTVIILPPDSNMYSRSTKMFREYINCLILSNSYFIFI